MSLDIQETLLIIGLVAPGLMSIYLGIKTWRKDWLAMETRVLLSPLTFIFIYFFSYAGYLDYYYPDSDLFWFIGLLLIALILIYLGFHGQIMVLRGNRDVVLRGVKGILDKLNLKYTVDGDRFDIPEINMKVEINYFETSDLVGVQTSLRRVPIWTKTIHEEVLNLFVGRPSERSHPAILVAGLVLLGIALGLGVVLNIG